MIARRTYLSVVAFVTVLGLSFQAWSLDLTDEYMLGKWLIDGTDCSVTSSEVVIFRDSGAVEAVRAGKLEAAGFWEISDDILVVHIVASPAFFHDTREEPTELEAFEGEYHAFRIRVVPFNIEPDRFGAVGQLGEQVNKGVFNRCKA
jgi:predicted Kef-type K+ transport protein